MSFSCFKVRNLTLAAAFAAIALMMTTADMAMAGNKTAARRPTTEGRMDPRCPAALGGEEIDRSGEQDPSVDGAGSSGGLRTRRETYEGGTRDSGSGSGRGYVDLDYSNDGYDSGRGYDGL